MKTIPVILISKKTEITKDKITKNRGWGFSSMVKPS